MKKTGIILLLAAFLLTNCEKEKDFQGKAIFSVVNGNEPYVGEELIFQNNSTGGSNYYWDFGDGNTSVEKSPTHIYSEIGTYKIILILSEKELIDYNADGIINYLDGEHENASMADTTLIIIERPTEFPVTLKSSITDLTVGTFYINGTTTNEEFDFYDLFSDKKLIIADSIEFESESVVKFYGTDDAPQSLKITYSFEDNKLNLISFPDYPEENVSDFGFPEMVGDYKKLESDFTIYYYYGFRFKNEMKEDLNMDGVINDMDKIKSKSKIQGSLSNNEVLAHLNITQELMGQNDTLLIFNYKQVLE